MKYPGLVSVSIVLFSLILGGLIVGCTEQESAKFYGGTAAVDLPAGRKLINVTWKESDLWYLTRPMTDRDSVETYTFKESSSWGMMEGTVVIKEHR